MRLMKTRAVRNNNKHTASDSRSSAILRNRWKRERFFVLSENEILVATLSTKCEEK